MIATYINRIMQKIHVANNVNRYFEERQIEVLFWPAKSPDINLMKSIAVYVKNKLDASYEDVKELEEDLICIWKTIPFEFLENLYNGLPRCFQAIIDVKGGPTNYQYVEIKII